MNPSTNARFALAACLAAFPCAGNALAQSDTVYTNSDLERLPAPENDRLPALEAPAPAGAEPGARIAVAPAGEPAAPPPVAAPVDPAPAGWIEQRLERLRFDQAVAEARRRLDAATATLVRLQGSLRPTGSAFPEEPGAVEPMYVRGVADPGKPHDDALQQAYRDRAAAQRDLDRLISREQGSAPSF
jgi:hypothetical protein